MKIKTLLWLLVFAFLGNLTGGLINYGEAYYDQTIERKVSDRIAEEKERMQGKLAYCERLCR